MSEVLILEFRDVDPALYATVNSILGLDPATGAGVLARRAGRAHGRRAPRRQRAQRLRDLGVPRGAGRLHELSGRPSPRPGRGARPDPGRVDAPPGQPRHLTHSAPRRPIQSGPDRCGSLLAGLLREVFGLWRSLVAHLTGGQGVAGSNPVSPTEAASELRIRRSEAVLKLNPKSLFRKYSRAGRVSHPHGQVARVPAKTCQARADFAVRLSRM